MYFVHSILFDFIGDQLKYVYIYLFDRIVKWVWSEDGVGVSLGGFTYTT